MLKYSQSYGAPASKLYHSLVRTIPQFSQNCITV